MINADLGNLGKRGDGVLPSFKRAKMLEPGEFIVNQYGDLRPTPSTESER